MISGTISLPSPGYFSTFIHITCALSVVSEYLALGHGRPGFSRGFSCPVILGILLEDFRISSTRLSLSLAWLSSQFDYPSISLYAVPQPPAPKVRGLGCFLFARRYWGNHIRFLFLRVLRWFSSPGLAFPAYFKFEREIFRHNSESVSRFGNLRVKACLRLTEAYRCLPRPSSPAYTKSSIISPL